MNMTSYVNTNKTYKIKDEYDKLCKPYMMCKIKDEYDKQCKH